jgi:hypothetical protein
LFWRGLAVEVEQTIKQKAEVEAEPVDIAQG